MHAALTSCVLLAVEAEVISPSTGVPVREVIGTSGGSGSAVLMGPLLTLFQVRFCLSRRNVRTAPGVSLDKTAADRAARLPGWRLVGAHEIVIREQTIQVQIDYPLQHPTDVTQHPTDVTLHADLPGGFTRRHLLGRLQAEYRRIYAEEEAAALLPDRRGRPLLNRWAVSAHLLPCTGHAVAKLAALDMRSMFLDMCMRAAELHQHGSPEVPI